MASCIYYIFIVLLYFLFLMFPVEDIESLIFISAVREENIFADRFYITAFHLILGFILTITLKFSYISKLILITMIPIFSFILLTISIFVTGDIGTEPEGWAYGVIATAMFTGLIFVGVIAGLILLKLCEPNKSLKNGTPHSGAP